MLKLLDELNANNVKFALSNVIVHKGYTNNVLLDWSSKYNTYYINKMYNNCSYQLKDRNAKTVEVLITNFIGDMPKEQKSLLPENTVSGKEAQE